MKTYCRWVDIEDPETIYPWVWDYLHGTGKRPAKWLRRDFSSLLAWAAKKPKAVIRQAVSQHDFTILIPAVEALCEECCKRIRERRLNLPPISYIQKKDGSSGKVRTIAIESAMQQIFDVIAVYAMMPMLKAKILPHQYASIEGRGCTQGKRKVEQWIRKNRDATDYIQADITKCFPSIRPETIMRFLNRDIHKNAVLLWLVEALIRTHAGGLNIGSLLSQWLCNYLMSYVFRFAHGLTYIRRGKRIRIFRHILIYMDDMLFMGVNASKMAQAMRKVEAYINSLGLRLHDWRIWKLAHKPIDMMAYVMSYDCTVIRRRIFKRVRRTFLRARVAMRRRGRICLTSARRVTAHLGFIVWSDSKHLTEKYHVPEIVIASIGTISRHQIMEAKAA